MENRKHKYKGQTILPCSYADSRSQGYRWYVVGYHHTGIMYDEQRSRRCRTLAEAKDAIDEQLGR